MRRPGLRAAVGVLILLLLPLFGTSTAAAAKTMTEPTSTALPISYHADMVVDAVHRRLYIADIVTSSVLVTDFDGRLREPSRTSRARRTWCCPATHARCTWR